MQYIIMYTKYKDLADKLLKPLGLAKFKIYDKHKIFIYLK